jgi:hypothetical protein
MDNPANNNLHGSRKIWYEPTIEMIDCNAINGPGNKATILNVKENTLSLSGTHGHKVGSPAATYTLSYVVAS